MSKKFAFLVHPRTDVARDMGRVWPPLGLVPGSAYDWAMRSLPIPPLINGHVRRSDDPDSVAGWIIVVPVGARQMLASRRSWVVGKVEEAIDRAERLGAEVIGLGALTAPVTGGGRLLRSRPGISVTNGNAFTAKLTSEAINRLTRSGTTGSAAVGSAYLPHIAFVGATGSVGACVVELAARDGVAGEMTLVARNRVRLDSLADDVRSIDSSVPVLATTDMNAVRSADLVVVLTSAAETLVRSEHLKVGAVVLDDTQPRNTDPRLIVERPDVTVIDGGMAQVDGLDIRADIGDMPAGYTYACLSETMLLAFDGHEGDFCVGRATVDQALHMERLASRFGHLGFGLGEFLSFGQPLATPTAHAMTAA